ncbi:hypothetical protein ACQPXM_25050 [Kribbella sp. CA-253562]|uniref:hypothetical protein n=1 Tax=Kribbella sp. CA-253562 TaxID=3239942 RepID=UPI003D8B1B34
MTALVTTFPAGLPNHNWTVTATAGSSIGHQGMLSAARYLAATAIDLVQQPDLLGALQQEFKERTAGVEWASLIADGQQPPVYEPPADFLAATGMHWPPPGIRWPVPEVVAAEQLGTTGPNLPPVS